jgi:hypothetical protein
MSDLRTVNCAVLPRSMSAEERNIMDVVPNPTIGKIVGRELEFHTRASRFQKIAYWELLQ